MHKLAIICALEEELAPFRELPRERILLIRSGVGKVNAAIAAMDAIHDGATCIAVAGVAGSIDPLFRLGDVVIAKSAIQHDIDVTALGFKATDIPFADTSRWNASLTLVQDICKAARSIRVPTRIGRILSGDRFIANREYGKDLHLRLGGCCVDMETAAVAQTCHRKHIPWVAIRTISDDANEQSPIDFPAFLASSAEKTAQIIKSYLSASR